MSASDYQAQQNFNEVIIGQRDLSSLTTLVAVPIIFTVIFLLWRPSSRTIWLILIAILGSTISFFGLGKLLWELTLDIAGFPSFKLPIWSVVYLIIYIIMAFAYLYFGLYFTAPDKYIRGFGEEADTAFIDSLYLSLCSFLSVSPDPSISIPSQGVRFLTVGQGLLSMFINAVIITKFVSSF